MSVCLRVCLCVCVSVCVCLCLCLCLFRGVWAVTQGSLAIAPLGYIGGRVAMISGPHEAQGQSPNPAFRDGHRTQTEPEALNVYSVYTAMLRALGFWVEALGFRIDGLGLWGCTSDGRDGLQETWAARTAPAGERRARPM